MNDIKEEAKSRVKGYILAAFGLVAALAWNDAVKALIEEIFPTQTAGILLKFIFALVMTLVIVIVSRYIIKEEVK